MNPLDKINLVVICGPTASGKTELAVKIAEDYNGEVISADSMQIYIGMDIATAKPTVSEMRNIPHHLINFLPKDESFSVVQYLELAHKKISEISARGKLPILAGGTGLYISSLIDNITFDNHGQDIEFRKKMNDFANLNGNLALLEKLRQIDPTTAEKLHQNNRSRVIRALEVYHLSKKTIYEAQCDSKKYPSIYNPIMIGLDFNPRTILHDRINTRVDNMLEKGLLEEAKVFLENENSLTSVQAIGYKELKPYLENNDSLLNCIEKLKSETRKYAKRQLTWFRKDDRISWIICNETYDFIKIYEKSKKILKKYGIYKKNML